VGKFPGDVPEVLMVGRDDDNVIHHLRLTFQIGCHSAKPDFANSAVL
jgi:hypothetical protein